MAGQRERIQRRPSSNVPDWTRTESYDITAKGTGVTVDTFRPMLVNVLKDRFQLRTHPETRELPVYRLLRADERSLGPKLQLADYDVVYRCA